MKTIALLSALLLAANHSLSQSFIEICPSSNTTGTIVNYEVFNGELYATGFFDQICSTSTDYLSKWNGTDWEATSVSLPNEGHALSVIGSSMYISCYVNSVDSNWVYQSDGTTIAPFGNGFYLTTATSFSNLPTIYDVVEYNGDLIVCGEFDRSGSDTVTGIARWNGTKWEDLGGGFSGSILGGPSIMYPHQMLVHNNELYVVGNFRYAGGVEVNGVAKWDGSSWSALGSGFNSTVYGIGTYNNEIWAGGDFTMAGTESVNRVAKWNGTS